MFFFCFSLPEQILIYAFTVRVLVLVHFLMSYVWLIYAVSWLTNELLVYNLHHQTPFLFSRHTCGFLYLRVRTTELQIVRKDLEFPLFSIVAT